MEIRKIIVLFMTLHFALLCYSQTQVQSREVRRSSGNAFLLSNGEEYKIRENIVLAKLKRGKKQVRNNIQVIKSNTLGLLEIAVPDSIATEEYIKALEKTGEFEYVEFVTYSKPCMSPNDSHYNNQWGIGHIHADEAWELTTGSPSVKIAVIDGDGFELHHSDLDYGNDNYSNISIIDYVNYVTPSDSTPIGPHGTMVAGVISAKTNNGRGIAGIAGGYGSEGSRIIPYCADDSSSDISAIYDAVEKGAKVINMSFHNAQSSGFDEAINYAYNNGVTIVCSSGNQYSQHINYPASHEHTIAVGSIDIYNNKAASSNYGEGLDLVAPGESIKSTYLNNSYHTGSGTSFAAPHVAGVIALMLSVNPYLTPSGIKNILINSTIKIKYGTYIYDNSGWNEYVGYGLVNACEAVVKALNCPISGPSFICQSSTDTYSISNPPSCCSVYWTINNSDFTITSSGNQCSVTYTGSQEYALANLTAHVYYNGYGNHFTKSIIVGIPPFDVIITGGDGSQAHWTSNLIGNTADVEELFDIPINYTQYEANLYRMSANFDPYDTLINHWSSFSSRHLAINNYLSPGWYLLQIRGINSCGISDWEEVEIECIDTEMLRANGDETELSLMYNRQGQILTVTVNRAAQSHSTIDDTYTIQLWNEMNMVREYKQKAPVVQIPMSGLKNGLYTVRYVNNNEVVSKKFFKH